VRIGAYILSQVQLDAALAAMAGIFTKNDVRDALQTKGLPWLDGTSSDVTQRLIQRQRKLGRIERIENSKWQALSI